MPIFDVDEHFFYVSDRWILFFASSLLVFIFKCVFEFIDNKGYQWLLFDNSYFFVVGGDDVFVNVGLCVCVSTLWIF